MGGGAVDRLGPSPVLASVVAVVLVAVDGQGGSPGASARSLCLGVLRCCCRHGFEEDERNEAMKVSDAKSAEICWIGKLCRAFCGVLLGTSTKNYLCASSRMNRQDGCRDFLVGFGAAPWEACENWPCRGT